MLEEVLRRSRWSPLVYGAPRLARWPRVVAGPLRRLYRGTLRPRRARFDVNVFLETIVAGWIPYADINVLIPNPECFHEGGLSHLDALDGVLCKSRSAAHLFRGLACSVFGVGFTTPDIRVRGVESHRERWLHVGGLSDNKGTEIVLEAWASHPEWPLLTVVARNAALVGDAPRNIRCISRRLPAGRLRRLQTEAGVHICPSSAEGYGHTIAEAMSCRALVLRRGRPPDERDRDGGEGDPHGGTGRARHMV